MQVKANKFGHAVKKFVDIITVLLCVFKSSRTQLFTKNDNWIVYVFSFITSLNWLQTKYNSRFISTGKKKQD